MLVISMQRERTAIFTVPPSDVSRTIEVRVLAINPVQVKLGITAPKEIAVLRDNAHETEPKPRIKPEWIARTPDDIN